MASSAGHGSLVVTTRGGGGCFIFPLLQSTAHFRKNPERSRVVGTEKFFTRNRAPPLDKSSLTHTRHINKIEAQNRRKPTRVAAKRGQPGTFSASNKIGTIGRWPVSGRGGQGAIPPRVQCLVYLKIAQKV